MTVDKYTVIYIYLSQEERSILEGALNVLRTINREIDESLDADEVRLSDNSDADLLNHIEQAINELSYSVKF